MIPAVAGSALLSFYLANYANYDATYGSLGAAIGLMMWMWMSTIVVLFGAELNSEIEHQTAMDTTTGEARAIGERGAVVADTVGPKRGSPAALAFTLKHAEALSDRLLRRRIRNR